MSIFNRKRLDITSFWNSTHSHHKQRNSTTSSTFQSNSVGTDMCHVVTSVVQDRQSWSNLSSVTTPPAPTLPDNLIKYLCMCGQSYLPENKERHFHQKQNQIIIVCVQQIEQLERVKHEWIKTPAHIRFYTLILLVPTPNMFLYLSYLSQRWNIRLVARLWLYLITTLSNAERLWSSCRGCYCAGH